MHRRVSIITVCRNSAKTIAATLESVRSQTSSNIEHIVIDGASTDGTQEIINAHRAQIAYFISEPDTGPYDAMNKGLTQATGDIICFLNSDDIYTHPDVVARVATQMMQRDLEVLYGDVVFSSAAFPERVIRRYRSGSFTPARLAWGWMPAHPALFMTADIYRRIGNFDTRYKIAGDYDFIIRAFWEKQIKAEHIPETLVRMQTGGISNAGWRSKLLLNREVLEACRNNGVRTNLLMILSKYPRKTFELLATT
ncbi:glycosyltransferase family 2 protein [Phyllobacterium leguminum]|uniref:Glycosyltransferase involved in cell wall biosynthesis n=1 Tax=Phyllobacterium leguminum TaxID=314237 RepID=A0A318SY32_9HYPH|nr:glycosyltransferase family 2 protein [Phyllobacterium leguminum]PYE85246.1 glycosyltransferase involved in cell wall biosynthesis [Phyllobacterium leguminum]